jgi:glucan phosphorylase
MRAVQKRLEAGVLQTRRPKLPPHVKPAPEGKRPHLFHFDVSATLPEPLRGLARLSRNLWWSWDGEATALFEELSPRSWDASGHNPVSFLQRVYPEDLSAKAADEGYIARLERTLARFDAYLAEAPIPSAGAPRYRRTALHRDAAHAENPIAYFCAEYGVPRVAAHLQRRSGRARGRPPEVGLDLNLPLVAVGPLLPHGLHEQRVSPAASSSPWTSRTTRAPALEPVKDENGRRSRSRSPLPGRHVTVIAWRARIGRVQLFLLDTNLASNRAEDRDITRNLYGGNEETRMVQEIVLGRGGKQLLVRLGIRPRSTT